MKASQERGDEQASPIGMRPADGTALLDVAAAAGYLGVTRAFVRRLVLERRVRYFKLGKFVRFRAADLDAFVETGRHDPVAPWVHPESTELRSTTKSAAQRPNSSRRGPGGSAQPRRGRGR